MGRGGPKPKPLQLTKLHGNPGQRALPEPIDGVGDLWAPPEWMDDEQRAQWIRGIEMAPRGLLTATDLETFESWVCAVVEYRRSAQAISREGQILRKKGSRPFKNPRLAVMSEQASIAFKASDRLGFSPGARASLGKAYAAVGATPGQMIGSKLAAYLEAKPDRLDN